MKYKVEDIFFVRLSNESIDKYKILSAIDKGELTVEDILKKNPIFTEALEIASQDLYQVIKNKKIRKEQEETIILYLIRNMVRPTPYGLFSKITRGEFQQCTTFGKEQDFFKCCMTDAEWFYKVAKKLELRLIMTGKIRVKFNEQSIIRGEKIINPYVINKHKDSEQGESISKIHARYTEQVKIVQKLANEWILYEELHKELSDCNPGIEKEVISGFLKKLYDNEILITEVRVSLTNEDLLEKLLGVLQRVSQHGILKDELTMLYKINTERLAYNSHIIGEGNSSYEKICNMMKSIEKTKNYLNVITGGITEKNTVSIKVKNAIEKFTCTILPMATHNNENIFLANYKRIFVKKYSQYREVALLELLDENMGLGNPYERILDNNIIRDEKEDRIKQYFESRVCLALKNNQKRIEISQEELKKLDVDDEKSNIPYIKSFELNVKILAKSKEDIDKGNFKVKFAPCYGSDGAGKMLNRFYNVLDHDGKDELNNIYTFLQDDLYSNMINADITYMPRIGRINNVCSGKRNYKFAVNCGIAEAAGQEEIHLNDILVGYDPNKNRLYLKSRKWGKRLRVLSDNMLTLNSDNYIMRFLREVTYSNEICPINIISLLQNLRFKYIPQISCDEIILIPETWKIEKNDFDNLSEYSSFVKEFKSLQRKWGIPSYVYILNADQYVLLDLSLDICWRILYSETKKIFKQSEEYIIQIGEGENELWIQDDNGDHYNAEFVLECLTEHNDNNQDDEYFYKEETPITLSHIKKNKDGSMVPDVERNLLPGREGWYYLKIYLDEENADDFVSNDINNIMNKLEEEKEIKEYFFIRYVDPEFQIRLRFKSSKGHVPLMKIQYQLELLKQKQKFKDYSIAVYEREIERYGGRGVIEKAEDFFCTDSSYVVKLLTCGMKKEDAAFVGVYNLLKVILHNNIEIEKFLNQIITHKEYHDDFRKNDKKYVQLIYGQKDILEEYKLESFNNKRNKALTEYYMCIKKDDAAGKLTNSFKDIILSLSHMFCNRIKGDNRWETWIYAMIRHSLHVINQREKYRINEKDVEIEKK